MLKAPLALLMMMAVSATAAEPSPSQVRPLQVGNLTIQQGKPAIIVSTTGNDEESALKLARQAAQTPQVQVVELRVDKLDFATHVNKVTQLGQAMRHELKGKPLLLTLRTKEEGAACRRMTPAISLFISNGLRQASPILLISKCALARRRWIAW